MAEEEVIADLFSTMLRNIVGNQYRANNRPLANPGSSDRGSLHPDAHPADGEDDHPMPPHLGPTGARLNPRNADSSQAGDTQVPDIHS